MIRLIVTENDDLYHRLSRKTADEGNTLVRAVNVVEAFEMATMHSIDAIFVDMSVHAADTLVETLHSRAATCTIPLYAVEAGARLPFALRRLCTDVLEADSL